jgi:cysteine desulfurase/selenocysteine lyase
MSGPPAPDWAAIRADYPAAAGAAYFDTACLGLPSGAAERAVIEHVALLRDPPGAATEVTLGMLGQFERARTAAATLVGAAVGEIALTPSTEAGIATIASALRLEPGTNVVASDLEFVGTLLPWRFLEHRGVELKLVPHREGRVEVADLEAAADARTRAVVVSSVQEVNGFRADLAGLARMCRDRGVCSLVDAVQHVGPLILDVAATPVDAVVLGGHKWLCAPFGMGFLYAAPPLLELLDPPARAFMTAQPPEGGWRNYLESPARRPDDQLRFPVGAEKLERGALGTTLAAAGLAASIESLLRIGRREIAHRSARLVELTAAALEEVGAEVVTPTVGPRSSIVTFRSSAKIEAERELVARLAEERIFVSLRFTTGVGGIRVAPYFYNDERDVERLVSVVGRETARARGSRPGAA